MTETDKNERRYILHSVSTAFSILDLFFDNKELSPAEVAKTLGINRSTAFRFLVTLEQCGYITKTPNSKYRLGVKVSSLGQIAQNRMELTSLIHPYLMKISETIGESSHLATMDNATHVCFIDKAVGSLWLKMDIMIGYRQQAHLTATGKAILAYKSAHFVNQYIRKASFEPHTRNSITDAASLLDRLEEIRIQGYSTDNEETEYGLYCVAVPILNHEGTSLAAISISGPSTRMIVHQDSHIRLLKEAAARIESAINN